MDIINKIKDMTSARQLVRSKDLVAQILLSPAEGAQQMELMLGQVAVAKSRRDEGWLRAVAREADKLQFAERQWIADHIFPLQWPNRSKEAKMPEPTRDIRLKSDPNLERVV